MTIPATSVLQDLVEGICQMLAADAPALSFQGVTVGTVGLYPMRLPIAADTPRGIAVAPYPLSADPTRNEDETGVQFLHRSTSDDAREVWATSELVKRSLLGRFPVTLPTGLHLSSLWWTSGASLGQDNGERWLWSDNFTAVHTHVTPHRA